jgi:hypothetical protein
VRRGWTPARKALFLSVLAEQGNVRVAAARVGISAQSAYVLRRRDGVFAAAWGAALVLAREAAEQVLADRALNGVEEAVFYHGEVVAMRRRYDSRLLLAHLARLDQRCGKDRDAARRAARFDELLAVVAGEEVPDALCPVEGFAREADPLLPATRADHVRFVGDASQDESDEWDAVSWEAACASAGEEWDEWHRRAVARVDDLEGELAGEGLEYKSRGGPETWPLDSVNRVNFTPEPADLPGVIPVDGRAIHGEKQPMPARNLLRAAMIATLAAAPLTAVFSQEAEETGPKFSATLTPGAEVPGPGHAGATGSFKVTINPKNGRVCATVSTADLSIGERMMHIHSGAAGASGPVVVNFDSFSSDEYDHCSNVAKDVAEKIIKSPGDYYANVHDADHPNGAIRGQLVKGG